MTENGKLIIAAKANLRPYRAAMGKVIDVQM